MKAFIWDLDGTLLDSYGVIVDSLYQIYKEKGFDIDKSEILHDVINESVSYFIMKMDSRFGVPFDDLKDRYSIISHNGKDDIKLMPHSIEILKFIKDNNIPNYVFTHRGVTTESILKRLGIYDYFDEIVTSLHDFKRKPDPEGLDYFINKYNLDRNDTYYVGDRPMDIKCANNAHIKSIMYIPKQSVATPTGQENYIIQDLLQIKDIIKFH